MIHKTKNKPNKKNNQTTTQKTKQTKRNKEGLGPREVARTKKTTNPTCPQQKHMFVKIWARNPKRVLMKFWTLLPAYGKKTVFSAPTQTKFEYLLFFKVHQIKIAQICLLPCLTRPANIFCFTWTFLLCFSFWCVWWTNSVEAWYFFGGSYWSY